MSDDIRGAGFDALDAALAEQLAGDDDYRWLSSDDSVAATNGLFTGIRAYRRSQPVPHWLYVTQGLTDLADKDSPDPERSGFGFELTCRVPVPMTRKGLFRRKTEASEEPPLWPFSVLVHLALYVFEKSRWFEPGHHFDLRGSIDGASELTAVVFAADPVLTSLDTVNGRVDFVQMVALDADELVALRSWDSDSFLALLRARDPMLMTDPDRASLLADRGTASQIREGIKRDGSSQVISFCDVIGWVRLGKEPRVDITLGAGAAAQVREAIPRTLRKGRPFICVGDQSRPNTTVVFVSAEHNRWLVDEAGVLVVQLGPELLDRFESSLVAPAILSWPELADCTLRILPAESPSS